MVTEEKEKAVLGVFIGWLAVNEGRFRDENQPNCQTDNLAELDKFCKKGGNIRLYSVFKLQDGKIEKDLGINRTNIVGTAAYRIRGRWKMWSME